MDKNIKNITGIYKITSPSGKVYIGQAKNVKKRYYRYKKLQCKTQRKLYNSLIKYGFENHLFEIIHECNHDELNHFEKLYIKEFNSFNSKNGLNLREGGHNSKMSDESKKILSDKKKGFKHTEDAKEKMSKSSKGKKHTPETLKHMSEIKKGKKHTEESKKKISESNKGKVVSEEGRKNMSNSQKGLFAGEKHPNYGKKMNEEHKEILRKVHTGKSISIEQKKKISESMKGEKNHFYGKKHSPETISKMKGRKMTETQRKNISDSKKGKNIGVGIKPISAISPNRELVIFSGVSELKHKFKLSGYFIYRCIKGLRSDVDGWTEIKFIDKK